MREKYFGLIWKEKTAAEEQPKAVVAQLRTTPPGKAPASCSQEGGRIYSFRCGCWAPAVNGRLLWSY